MMPTAVATKTRTTKTKPPTPTPVVLVCEVCNRRVHGDAGFAAVDRRDIREHSTSAPWRIWHVKCCPAAVAPLNPYVRVWASRLKTTDDLLDTVAELSRMEWFSLTDWGSLIRRAVADSRRYGDKAHDDDLAVSPATLAAREARARRRAQGLPPDDPRHGTAGGYSNYGCKCEPCRAAGIAATRNGAQIDVDGMSGTVTRLWPEHSADEHSAAGMRQA